MVSGSDHYSLWCTINVKFAKPKKPLNKQTKFELNIDQATKQAFNQSFKLAMENINTNNEGGHKTMDETLKQAANTLEEKSPKIKNYGLPKKHTNLSNKNIGRSNTDNMKQ